MNIHWTKLTHRFPDEKQCLASFIAWQAAEVIAGAKPANLINILDRELACGRNMSSLWEKHKTSVLKSPLKFSNGHADGFRQISHGDFGGKVGFQVFRNGKKIKIGLNNKLHFFHRIILGFGNLFKVCTLEQMHSMI